MNPERAIAYRKQASALLEAVLSEEITARAALNTWPLYGNEDPSVRCAYTMLWYFESDEERHKLELFYADIQLKGLREANSYLKKGEPLPYALLREYQGTEAPPEYNATWTWREPLWWLRKQFETMKTILETHPSLAKAKKTKQKGPR